VAGKTVAQALAVHQFEQELFDEITSELDVRSLQRRTEQGFDEIALDYLYRLLTRVLQTRDDDGNPNYGNR